jgi:UDP-glucose 4-epimerase
MKILVIGGAGYIGSHVCRELLDAGFEVMVYDNLSTGLRQNLFAEAQFREGNILDVKALNDAFTDYTPDAVIHLAALKAAGESMLKPEKYSTHNITGSLNILNACTEHNVKYFIFSSSAAVYGDPLHSPLDETHPQEPVNYYGYTKLAIEHYLNWYSRLKDLKFVALRYFNAAGYDVQGRISGLEQNPANLIPVVMEAASGMRSAVQVFGDDYETSDGTGVRDYIHVNDLASGHLQALRYLKEGGSSNSFNLGTGQGYSVLDVIKTTEKVSGKKVAYQIVERRAGDPAELLATADKAEKALSWKAQYSDLQTILDTTWKAYQKNKEI